MIRNPDIAALVSVYLGVMGLWLINIVVPGPSFVATVHTAIRRSRMEGVAVALGTAAGNVVWAAAVLLGLDALLRAEPAVDGALKIGGAAYLLVSGVGLVWTAGEQRGRWRAEALPARPRSIVAGIRHGMLVSLANVRPAAFFLTVFAVLVPADAPGWFVALLIASGVTLAGGWLAAMACAVTSPGLSPLYLRGERFVTLAAGGLLIYFGVAVAASVGAMAGA